MTDTSNLTVDVKPGEGLSFSGGGAVLIELVAKSGQRARLRITAPRGTEVKKVPQVVPCMTA